MPDLCLKASVRSADLEVAIASTTELCKEAQKAHNLALTSAVALGRLLTAATLMAQTAKRKGTISLQVLSKGRMRGLFADVNDAGEHRGFARNAELAFPHLAGEEPDGRRSVALATMPGTLSVVRQHAQGGYGQSSVELISGELDLDVEHYLEQSDQIPTALSCDVRVDADGRVRQAAGILVQGLPGADLEQLSALRRRVHQGGLARAMKAVGADAHALLAALVPGAVEVERPAALSWRCRCSKQRVLDSIRLLEPADISELLEPGEAITVSCDLCSAQYLVQPAELAALLPQGTAWAPPSPKSTN